MPEMSPLTPFPVLKLPPEIRNQIWRYAVLKNGDVNICLIRHHKYTNIGVLSCLRCGHRPRGHQADDERKMKPTPLALAPTSRQLYLEAALVYYSENIFNFFFHFRDHEMLKEFIAAVGPQNASSITAARFGPTMYELERVYYPIDPFLSVLPGLKQIIVNIDILARDLPLHASPRISLMDAYAQSHTSAVVKVLKHHDLRLIAGQGLGFVERPIRFGDRT